MKRILSDNLTKELTFLRKPELTAMAEQLGISKRTDQLDWFDTIKFLCSNFEDEDMKDLIDQYQRNIDLSTNIEKKKELLHSIRQCYTKIENNDIQQDIVIKRKRGRPKKSLYIKNK